MSLRLFLVYISFLLNFFFKTYSTWYFIKQQNETLYFYEITLSVIGFLPYSLWNPYFSRGFTVKPSVVGMQ